MHFQQHNACIKKKHAMKPPLSNIAFQTQNTAETCYQIIEKPHTLNFRSQSNCFLAHDEQTDWIPQSFTFLSLQSLPTRL